MYFELTGMNNTQFANFDYSASVLQACCKRAASVLPLHTLQYKIPHCKVFVNSNKRIDNVEGLCYNSIVARAKAQTTRIIERKAYNENQSARQQLHHETVRPPIKCTTEHD